MLLTRVEARDVDLEGDAVCFIVEAGHERGAVVEERECGLDLLQADDAGVVGRAQPRRKRRLGGGVGALRVLETMRGGARRPRDLPARLADLVTLALKRDVLALVDRGIVQRHEEAPELVEALGGIEEVGGDLQDQPFRGQSTRRSSRALGEEEGPHLLLLPDVLVGRAGDLVANLVEGDLREGRRQLAATREGGGRSTSDAGRTGNALFPGSVLELQ